MFFLMDSDRENTIKNDIIGKIITQEVNSNL